jgi:hypothetical protein
MYRLRKHSKVFKIRGSIILQTKHVRVTNINSFDDVRLVVTYMQDHIQEEHE